MIFRRLSYLVIALSLVLGAMLSLGLRLSATASGAVSPHSSQAHAVGTDSSYAIIDSAGGVMTYGGAGFYGDTLSQHLVRPIVGAAANPAGGYWLVASDGGIFSFGAAQFYGSMGGHPLNKPVVGMAAMPTGGGYWEVASDGGIFSFGAAPFHGSLGAQALVSPISAMEPTPDDGGYWMVAVNGDVYAFGDALYSGGGGTTMTPPGYPAGLSDTLATAVQILALPPGPQALHVGQPRLLFMGDSLGWYEAYYTSSGSNGYQVENGATPGCGITNGATMFLWNNPLVPSYSPPACADWQQQFSWAVHRYHPDAVDLQLGYWEVQPRLYNGQVQTLNDPAYASFIESNLLTALQILHSEGALVILNTAPYYGDGTPASIVNVFNSMIEQAAQQDSSFVTVLNVNQLLDPNGVYTPVIDGQTVRTPDNVHLTSTGVTNFIDPTLNSVANPLIAAVFNGGS